MREDQSFPAQVKSKQSDTFESLWGEFSENWSKIGPQTAGARIVPQEPFHKNHFRAQNNFAASKAAS